MDETEAWVGTITESGLSTTMVGMVPGFIVEPKHVESCWGPAEGTGEVGVDSLTTRSLSTVTASAEGC